MLRSFFFAGLIIFLHARAYTQCPTISLSASSGSTCGTSGVTISDNTFGDKATWVIIRDDGSGSVTPSIVSSSPFTFTYRPGSDDYGKKITITFLTNDPPGKRCTSARATYTLSVNTVPSAPGIGTVSQPTCSNPTGSVILQELPASGRWTITSSPDGKTFTGTGSTTTISNLQQGRYNFRVANSAGCTSSQSGDVNIQPSPFIPSLKITDPAPVCSTSTADLTAPAVTAGSSPDLTYTYWKNSSATQSYSSPSEASEGTYYIKGTASSGCSDIKPVRISAIDQPIADAGPDQVLKYQFKTTLGATEPGRNETGSWSLIKGSGSFSNADNPTTIVDKLSLGKNIFLWTIKNEVCLPSYDSVTVTVLDLVVPTLITPNMDGRNDCLVVPVNETTGKAELYVFDRYGFQVYASPDYKNDWNGIDSDGNPLREDTYFYVLKFLSGRALSGYVVIRR